MSTGLDAISETAFNDFCCWAIQQPNIRQRFALDTGHDVEALIRASIIEKMIDDASGRTNAVTAAWIDWVRTNFWGDSSTQTTTSPES